MSLMPQNEAPAEAEQPHAPDQPRSGGRGRWLVRGAFLLLALVALIPLGDAVAAMRIVPAASPLVALASAIATRSLQVVWVVGFALLLAAVVRRRWFCRWVCPTGLCADTASWVGARLGRGSVPLPPVGSWILLITLGGAAVGYPLLLWLDPLALLAGAAATGDRAATAVVWWSGVPLAAVLALSLAFPRLWCVRLCPAGALQDLAAEVKSLARRGTSPPQRQAWAARGFRLTRRAAASGLIGWGWAALVMRGRRASARPLRPPGALDEAAFPGVCIRCGNCLRICPAGVIEPEMGEGGIASFLAPRVRFVDDYCREDCVLCTEACPSGALGSVTVEEKVRAKMGVVRVDMDVCLLGDNRDCAACLSHCPYEAIRFVFCEEDYTLTPHIDPARCPGCGACEIACPTEPIKAIVVVPPAACGPPGHCAPTGRS